MKKMVYIARSDRLDGDSFDIKVTFDAVAAREALDMEYYHLTPRELKNTFMYIEGHLEDVLDGETAKEAYNRITEDLFCLPDPDYYEEYGSRRRLECMPFDKMIEWTDEDGITNQRFIHATGYEYWNGEYWLPEYVYPDGRVG